MPRPKKAKTLDDNYKVSIKLLGKVYSATGTSVREALLALKVGNSAKGTAILSVSRGDKTVDRVLRHAQVGNIFSPSKTMREMALKNVCLMFDL